MLFVKLYIRAIDNLDRSAPPYGKSECTLILFVGLGRVFEIVCFGAIAIDRPPL
ncbi:MAG: hypothetical protein HC849_05900 [Oscillatoriales cyanobacterium RU_3_3]|nr:hypothetical protein [Microcoleus sp. SU_5_6]NJL67279.1 hypothetical protein [Microcoleus sp. SM1_3_4]NJM59828.1 hypothetical protein [Oscillatoriales cyanobacterium RU_3_3]NJR21158.1 hypothetical protein [Richelia sp. CSU_2_1]